MLAQPVSHGLQAIPMLIPRPKLLFLLLPLWVCGACDNVGRAFDRPEDPDDPVPGTGPSPVQVVPIGGDARDGRPAVRATYPSGAGWQPTVPIVVEFSESVNEASIQPSSPAGSDGRVILRISGQTQVLPCQYDFLASGRLLVMRPVSELVTTGNPTYQVVLLPEARDTDGVRFQVPTGGTVLAEFQVNQAAEIEDGRILAVFPRDNQRDLARENGVFVAFDRPANAPTLTGDNIRLRLAGGDLVPTTLIPALQTLGATDPRLVLLQPNQPLPASASVELEVTADITFGQDGNLDFRGRTPFARFTAVAPLPPLDIALQNPLNDFPNKINRNNQQSARLRITLPPGAEIGDLVRVRIYGGDALTEVTSDLGFVERTAEVTTLDPPQGSALPALDVDFAEVLGNETRPVFTDGDITFAAQIRRGSSASGFRYATATGAARPRFDITPPTLVRAGPPGSEDGSDYFSDVEYVAFYGTASEGLAAATMTVESNAPKRTASTVDLFSSDVAGRFMMEPAPIGRRPIPAPYTLTLQDLAGNHMTAGPAVGNVRQRGYITAPLGPGVLGTLLVEAFDQATLLPIAGATVLVDVGAPPTQLAPGVTGADGRVAFQVQGGDLHTITIVRSGYDLVTLMATQAGVVSLPLSPVANRTATWAGNVTFPTLAGGTVILSNSAIDGGSPIGVQTASQSPNQIPDVAILPNRPQFLSGFSVVPSITGRPTFAAMGLRPSADLPPAAPVLPGATGRQNLSLVEAIPSPLPNANIVPLVDTFPEDFSAATASGLVLNDPEGSRPQSRVTMSLEGFATQVIAGIGFTQAVSGDVFTVDADYSLSMLQALIRLSPVGWVVTQASDSGGRISRSRAFLDLVQGSFVRGTPPALPVISSPAPGPVALPLTITYQDVVAVGSPVQGVFDITVRDPAGRRWLVLDLDRDDVGVNSLRFPDVTAAGQPGLASGEWVVQVEARSFVSVTLTSVDDLMLTERTRQEVAYSRSAAVRYTVP